MLGNGKLIQGTRDAATHFRVRISNNRADLTRTTPARGSGHELFSAKITPLSEERFSLLFALTELPAHDPMLLF